MKEGDIVRFGNFGRCEIIFINGNIAHIKPINKYGSNLLAYFGYSGKYDVIRTDLDTLKLIEC